MLNDIVNEEKAIVRIQQISSKRRNMRKHFPMTKFRRLSGVGHGGLAALQPKRLMRDLERVMDGTPHLS